MTHELAEQLWKARVQGTVVDASAFELPDNEEDAYGVQQALCALADVKIIGFKVGATSEAAVSALGVSGPFHGPLFDHYCRASGDNVPVHSTHQAIVESEIVVGLAHDLPPRETAYSQDEVDAATAWIAPGLEVVAKRFNVEAAGNGNLLIADGGMNMDFVLGEKLSDWSKINLSQHPATLSINEQEAASGHSGMSLFEHPFGVVAWLANQRTLRKPGLKSGDIITTGTCTGLTAVNVGDRVHADFGALGHISTRMVQA